MNASTIKPALTRYVVEQLSVARWVAVSREFHTHEQATAYIRTLPSDREYRVREI